MAEKTDPVLDLGLTGRKKVLVAEDEQNIASLLEDWLSETYDVILAYNGAAALQKAKWNKPDILIMDIMMPDTGGYEVVCALQGDPVTAKIPVIVMTAKNFDDSTVKLIKAEPNVYGFLNKPFKPDELKKQIAGVMAGERSFTAPSRRTAPPRPEAPPSSPPSPAALPVVPPTPALVLSPPPLAPIPQATVSPPPPPPRPAAPPAPPAPVPMPSVPPTPGVILPPPAAPPPRPAAPSVAGLVHGFPEIVPSSPIPPVPPVAAPGPVSPPPAAPAGPPLPPFLRPTPPPLVATAPPAPPPPLPSSPSGLVLEPTSALPSSVPMEPVDSISLPPSLDPGPKLAAPVSHPVAPPKRKPVLAVSPHQDDEDGGASLLMVRGAFWALKNVAKVVIFLTGVLGAAEMAVRWTEQSLGAEPFVPPLRPSRYAELPHSLPANGGWSHAGVTYAINEWGLRDGKTDLIKPAGAVRVFLLGGTSLFGEKLPAESTLDARLTALLAEEKGRYEVINGGVWGYSPEEQWAFYEKAVFELKPDVLVWLCEDKKRGFPASDNLRDLAQGSYLSSSLFKGSHFVRVLRHRALFSDVAPRPTDFLALIRPAEGFARESETKFLYAVFPDREMTREEWSELPDRGKISIHADARRAYLDPAGRAAALDAVARAVLEKLREISPAGSGKK